MKQNAQIEVAWEKFLKSNVPFAEDRILSREIFNAGHDAGYAAARSDGSVDMDAIADVVHDALNSYRCQHYLDHDGSGLGLVDRLSPDEDSDIKRGTEELAALEDYICGELSDFLKKIEPPQPSTEEV